MTAELELLKSFDSIENSKHKLILKFMAYYNMTPSELQNLKIEDVNFSTGEIALSKSKRTITLDESLKVDLNLYLKKDTPKEFLFEGRYKSKPITRLAFHRICSRLSKKLIPKGDPITPNKLRNVETLISTDLYKHQKNFKLRNEVIESIYLRLKEKRNLLLTGPIGVGKSYILKSLVFDKKALYLDDFSDLKATLVNWLLLIHENDKEKASKALDASSEKYNLRVLQKHSVPNLLRSILDATIKYEYVVLVDSLDNIPPRVIKCLDLLKSQFLIVACARSIPKKKESLLWDFDILEVKSLTKEESLLFLDSLFRTNYNFLTLSKKEKEKACSNIYSYSKGNPRVILELFKRFKYSVNSKELRFDSLLHEGLKKEICVSFLFPLFLFFLIPFRYISSITENPYHRLIGCIAVIGFFGFRHLRRLI